MGRMLPRSERRENDFSTPFAALESSKYETGPTSTGTVSTPSCIEEEHLASRHHQLSNTESMASHFSSRVNIIITK
jgi:hypothetical protein